MAETRAPDSSTDTSTRCDGCKSCGAILELDCGHRFHPRCIFTWPATHCETCDAPVATVRVFRELKSVLATVGRKGKWSIDEHKYANMMMKQFQLGALPLPDGLHLRVFMANILQCDPLRVTKKYAGQQIGKQNFLYQRNKNYCYNLHIKLQKQVSSLRNHFYWHIQYRCKFGHSLDIQAMKAAEADYWIREFRKFAAKIGQYIELTTAPEGKPAQEAVKQTSSEPLKEKTVESASVATFKPIALPPISSLGKGESLNLKGTTSFPSKTVDDDSTAPSVKDELEVWAGYPSMERSESPLSADEWNNPSAFVDLSFEDVTATEEIPLQLSQGTGDSKKKPAWMTDLMKEAELEWSKGAISWSLSLSSEPLSDFA
ncbi:hypothetical protein PHYBOEH_004611 [Phytophthora boehmeriae]|uniref:RING-type domain-containing protein n=1 Tax=Phytophthora boehmeriae TaxID=109152 RepID=A0A8T1WN68_9STRA|nr:hypothetical protein PHYBOEH_004611 [Phytophthora boehmeriae]